MHRNTALASLFYSRLQRPDRPGGSAVKARGALPVDDRQGI